MQEQPAYDEKALQQQVAEGSETAFHRLFNAYSRKLFTYVYRITESREVAEDAVQDIFLKLWDKRTALPAISNLNAYLHRMAHNIAYQGFRRLARETLLLEYLREETSPPANPGQELVSKEIRTYIQTLVDKLTPQQRRVFLLSRENGLKQEEIARQLGISIFSVKKHMVDALRFLRDEITQNHGSQAIAIFVLYQIGPV